ncbi:MAG: hypothetical protein JWR64_1214, partial [Marmoricola sp.]|nr:hypothetical protein [Marmoricola sp.]
DAAGAAMVYLCAGGRDLATPAGMQAAVLAYNHSAAYLSQVLAWKAVYDTTDLTGLGSASPSMFHASALPAPATPARASQLQTRPAKTRAATPVHGWNPSLPVPSGSTPASGQTPTPTSPPSHPTPHPTPEPTPTDPTPTDPTDPTDPTPTDPTDPTPTDPAPEPTPTDPTPTDPTPTDPTPTDPTPTDPTPTDPTPTCPTPVPPVQTPEPGPVRRVDPCAPELPPATPSPAQ